MGASITRRLTTRFVLAMAVLLLASGAIVYGGVRFSLDRTLRRQMSAQSSELVGLVRSGALDRRGSKLLVERADTYDQVFGADGEVLASSPPLAGDRLLTRRQLDEVHATKTFDRGSITKPGTRTLRIRATRVGRPGEDVIAVTAVRRTTRDEALRELAAQLLGAGLATLACAALVGFQLTRSALRPVERMRAQASKLYSHGSGGRIDVPSGGDELTRLAATLNELLGRVDRTIERERSFAADASHELRTPLTLLRTELDVALSRPRSAGELTETMEAMRRQTDRLIRLAEDLLLVAAEPRAIHAVPVELASLVRIAAKTALQTHDDGRHIDVRILDDLVVSADPELLERVLQNLLRNALEHGAGTVTVTTSGGFDGIQLHVLDEGAGFAPEFVEQAFERFAQASPGRSSGGSGLGLAIVRDLAAAHGWSVGAANRPEGGADVWIEQLRPIHGRFMSAP
jgi:signal transduction histidine kinase